MKADFRPCPHCHKLNAAQADGHMPYRCGWCNLRLPRRFDNIMDMLMFVIAMGSLVGLIIMTARL